MYKSLIELIASELGLDLNYVKGIIINADYLYKTFTIPKNNGKTRLIFQPRNELKTLQYWISKRLLYLLPVSNNATAYIRGKSIKNNAEVHLFANHVFHSDIKNFFPSITGSMLYSILANNKQILESNGLWFEDTLDTVTKICFRKGRLCIGAVTSPLVSNIIMYSFDKEIENYCLKYNYKYSRYADDLYISSINYINDNLCDYVKTITTKYKFAINRRKTKYISSKNNIKITGINIVNKNRLSINTDKKKMIKKMIYNYLKHNNGNPEIILGHLSFLKSVEPFYFNSIVIKYSQYINDDIITFLINKIKVSNNGNYCNTK